MRTAFFSAALVACTSAFSLAQLESANSLSEQNYIMSEDGATFHNFIQIQGVEDQIKTLDKKIDGTKKQLEKALETRDKLTKVTKDHKKGKINEETMLGLMNNDLQKVNKGEWSVMERTTFMEYL